MAIDKSKWNTKVKVSQSTIDQIKKMGMKQALGSVAGAKASMKDDSSAAQFYEGVRRLYGANRVDAATKPSVKVPAKPAVRKAVAGRGNVVAPMKKSPGKSGARSSKMK